MSVTSIIAAIEIPHQGPARLGFYGQSQSCGFNAEKEIMQVACVMADDSGVDHPADVDEALELIAEDLYASLVIRNLADIEMVESWVKNNKHQAHLVATFLPELRETMERDSGDGDIHNNVVWDIDQR